MRLFYNETRYLPVEQNFRESVFVHFVHGFSKTFSAVVFNDNEAHFTPCLSSLEKRQCSWYSSVSELGLWSREEGQTHGHCLDKFLQFLNLNFTTCKVGITMLTSQAREGHFHVWNKKLSQVD